MNLENFEIVSFDCYGTLIDWESGIITVLKNLIANHQINISPQQILEMFAKFESEAEAGEYIKYREVLKQVVEKIGKELNFQPTESELNSLANSIKNWQPFPDTITALQTLKQKYRIAIISNIDDDLFTDTAKHLQIEFDFVITAQQIKSYKPSQKNFKTAIKKMEITPEKLLHIAQSIYHDIVPAKAMGLSTIWVNRRQEKEGLGATLPASEKPDLEVPDLKTLVDLI
ncbi:haloacid dehalogenase type II [Okeania sp. SIO1I7]|uniref:haloacid dehalogenase type II n=1 Tax=Okeania sp. SIO1I7 TaxID=2607772 RepID=UPI0013F997A8|nr:haloacid dehalogenase type II [Okeania sp. SIO1I7]NET26729.1 haloacid dehalogenase type II [Okeania sp. SIO1I7]